MAFQTLCKQRGIGEGEAVPFLVNGEEVLVIWPDGASPAPLRACAPTRANRW